MHALIMILLCLLIIGLLPDWALEVVGFVTALFLFLATVGFIFLLASAS